MSQRLAAPGDEEPARKPEETGRADNTTRAAGSTRFQIGAIRAQEVRTGAPAPQLALSLPNDRVHPPEQRLADESALALIGHAAPAAPPPFAAIADVHDRLRRDDPDDIGGRKRLRPHLRGVAGLERGDLHAPAAGLRQNIRRDPTFLTSIGHPAPALRVALRAGQDVDVAVRRDLPDHGPGRTRARS
jgi:hypothetical protein